MPTLSGEVTTEVDFDFEVFCSECGAGLCSNCTEGKTTHRGMPFIRVEPCGYCDKVSYNSGYDDGYKEAKEEIED